VQFIKNHSRFFIILILLVLIGATYQVALSQRNTGHMIVAFLDIGQGDAIYIETPDHYNILIDAGPDAKVVGELQKIMRWHDRHIDVLMITNPDKDHIAGFIPVLARYKVSKVIEPGTINSSEVYKALEKEIKNKNIEKTIAIRGQKINLGSQVSVDILFPDRDIHLLASNTGSIISRLVFASTSVMLTGDATYQIEEYILELGSSSIQSTILKEGHHGSRTSVSETFFRAVHPTYVVISAGRNNKYGHPHKETTDLLGKLGIPILGTYNEGTIVFYSDGKEFSRVIK